MKKIYSIILGLPLILTLSGCYDLGRVPADQMNASQFYQNEEQTKEAMMAVYSNMQNDHAFGMHFAMDGLGGISMGYGVYAYQNFQTGRYDVNNNWILNKWTYLYEGVARANNVLQNVDKANMSDDLKKQYKAEAKFMRALYYFTLMDFFGEVPIYDETLVITDSYSDMKKPRNSMDEVRKFILDDLTEASNGLPEKWGKSDMGRATKYAAVALMGKVYLYAKNYTKASENFKKVIDSKLYALYDDYAGLFKPGGDESSEMIFAVQNMGGVGTDHGMPMAFYMGSRETFGSCWNNVMVSPYFVDSYEYKTGEPFDMEKLFPGITKDNKVKIATFRATLKDGKVVKYPAAKDKLLEMYKQRDPRMMATVILPYTRYAGWYANAPEDCEFIIATGINSGNGYIRPNQNYETYLWRKFVPEGNMGGAINNRQHTPINFPLIRYADVLLMQAECLNELGQQDEAVKLINEVRNRPSVKMPGINSGPDYLKATTKEEVFKRIRHERAVEFAGEGLSFSDMKRWKTLEELDGRKESDITGKYRYTRSVKSRDYLWPIPGPEREKNSALTQNPDW
ncbi:RagB/SusD family nutrient uptake outer membrane protein [Prevotella sp. S7 MS 2]|uniref:RagB/SusD family nutrient uptake outer membrane protein n=1 Tax=Prevotella sp. S7 MS 2 TaxID=1287488 RepID=UPI00051403A4|nr:RagB/SusD family nutrient uptake outer membrane protein [Prevotella sp. S7 MS 2]KGI60649.1 membrane protein [Prevotella sp. S7 MS 2]